MHQVLHPNLAYVQHLTMVSLRHRLRSRELDAKLSGMTTAYESGRVPQITIRPAADYDPDETDMHFCSQDCLLRWAANVEVDIAAVEDRGKA